MEEVRGKQGECFAFLRSFTPGGIRADLAEKVSEVGMVSREIEGILGR